MKKFTLLLSIGLFFTFMLKAEEILRGAKANQKIENAELIRYKEGVGAPVFIRFQKDKGPLASHLSAWLDQHYGTNGSFTFTTIIEEEDQKGFTHIKMQQLVGGIVVEHAILKAHVLNGRVHSMNGYVLVDPVFTSHLLSEAQSLEGALNKIRASSYKWEIAGEEQHLKMMTNNPNASYYPVGEKVFLPAAMDFTSQKLIPCYKFDIYAHEPIYRADVYVSAITGEVVFEDMTIKHVDSMGTAVTSFSGTQSITTNYNSVSGTFSLSETGRGNGIRTYDMLNTTNTNNAVSFSNTTNFWKDTLRYRYATDAHWGAEMVYDYYMTVHNRNSLDNNGFALISYVHYGSGYNNAFWNGTAMHYGDGSGSSLPYTTLDICGHEVSHGLTSNTADLVYQYEPGALNESFSDIFGCAIEISVKPNAVKNWLMGEDRGNHIRNMGNPNQKADPDTYLGTYWATGTADNGGVHTNSGVQNYWFYLLTLGGSGTNDNNDVFSVAGLGVAKSEAIAFRNLTVYLTPSSDYSDARFYSIESAIDLFGPCSPEMESTENAWYAVGVGPAYTPGVVSDFSATRTEACVLPAEIGFINLCNNNAQTFIWDFGDGQTSTAENPVHIYRTPGTYTVKLSANSTSCGSGVKTEPAFIEINPPPAVQTANVVSCINYPAKLTATGSGLVRWFSDTLGGTPIHVGPVFVTNPLTQDAVYYAQNAILSTEKSVGPDTIYGFGDYFDNYQYQIFDVYDYLTIKSVVVFANGKKDRTIELRDSNGQILHTKTVNIPHGTQTVTLDFDVAPGTDYQLGVSQGSSPSLYRYKNGVGVHYPYTLNGLMSITKSSAGTGPLDYYYFFFDWVVRAQDCRSGLTPVHVTMDKTPGCLPFWSGIDESSHEFGFDLFPNPANGNFALSFTLEKTQFVSAELIDVSGKKLMDIVRSDLNSGQHKIDVDAGNLKKGMYMIRLSTESDHAVKKLMLID